MPADLDLTLLRRALREIVEHHDALRMRFEPADRGWRQYCDAEPAEIPLEVIDLSHLADEERAKELIERASELQESLNIYQGPLFRVGLFFIGEHQRGRLLWVIHHLVVDAYSWRILLEDLGAVYQQLRGGQAARLPSKTTSYRQWAERLVAYARSGAAEAEPAAWDFDAGEGLPVDHRGGSNTTASSRHHEVSLSEAETHALLFEVHRAFNTQVPDLLLTAAALSFEEWTSRGDLVVNVEGHGREEIFEDVDLSRTVGWFTSLWPLRLRWVDRDPAAALKAIKEQVRAVPRRGIAYGVLRYLGPRREFAWPEGQVSLNYLGRIGRDIASPLGWSFARESPGPTDGGDGLRRHLIEINCLIVDDRLQLTWTYSENLHRADTIQRLSSRFLVALRRVMEACLSPDAGGYTPSDFPLAELNQSRLDELTEALGEDLEAIYPLTPLQRGLLFHCTYGADPSVYATQLVFTICGKLDTAAFRAAWQGVIERYPILRSHFIWEGREQPLQVVRRRVEVPWREEDWRHEVAIEERVAALIAADQGKGFALDRPPCSGSRSSGRTRSITASSGPPITSCSTAGADRSSSRTSSLSTKA